MPTCDAATQLLTPDPAARLQAKTIRDGYPLARFEAMALIEAGRGREALALMQAMLRVWPDPGVPNSAWLRIAETLIAAHRRSPAPNRHCAARRCALRWPHGLRLA